MKKRIKSIVSLSFDADQITTGTSLQQLNDAVGMINDKLQNAEETYAFNARLSGGKVVKKAATKYIPVYIYGDVEPGQLRPEKSFEKAIEALVLHCVEQSDDGGNYVMVIKPGKLPTLESFCHGSWDEAKERLLTAGKINASEAEGLH